MQVQDTRQAEWTKLTAGCGHETGPVVVRHGSAWLRIAPDQEPRWFPSENQAMEYAGG